MGSFTSKSQIETFRLRRHGAGSRFRFLSDSDAGYKVEALLSSHFYVNRRFSAEVGAHVVRLTFDAPVGFDFRLISETCYRGDLVAADDSFKRYSLKAETPPTAGTENRFRFLLEAEFGDETPIVA